MGKNNEEKKQANKSEEVIKPGETYNDEAVKEINSNDNEMEKTVEKTLPEKNEIQVSHYLDEKGFLLQRRGGVLIHLGKKASDKAGRKLLDSKIKSYKGKK